VEEARTVLVGDEEDVGKSAGRDERCPGAAAGEQRIRPAGRPQSHCHGRNRLIEFQSQNRADGKNGGFFARDQLEVRARLNLFREERGGSEGSGPRVEGGDAADEKGLAPGIEATQFVSRPEAGGLAARNRIAEPHRPEQLTDLALRNAGAEDFAFDDPVVGRAGDAVGERPPDVDPEFPGFHGEEYTARGLADCNHGAAQDGYRSRAAGPRTGWHQARSYSPGTEGFGCFFVEVTRARTYKSSSSNVYTARVPVWVSSTRPISLLYRRVVRMGLPSLSRTA